jgi:hypothetical protein
MAMRLNQDEQTYVYFELSNEGFEDTPTAESWDVLERLSISEVRGMLCAAGISIQDVGNEGHTADGSLLCYFRVLKEQVNMIADKVKHLHGGGDDIIYLHTGYYASSWYVVDHPGLSQTIHLYDYCE